MAGEGVFPKSPGDVGYSSEINGLYYGEKFTPLIQNATMTDCRGIFMHTTTDWTMVNGSGTQITSDSGATWTAASVDNAAMTGAMARCEGTRTSAICFDHDANDGYITSDSGDNWAQMTTAPGAGTIMYDVSFPTTAVAVCGGSVSSGRSIYRSTDAGDTWTVCTTGPTTTTLQVSMYNATHGFAVDVPKNVWYTTDGGDNWTDTTFNVSAAYEEGTLKAISTTEYLYSARNGGTYTDSLTIKYGTNLVAPVIKLYLGKGTRITTNFVISDNGYIYIASARLNADSGTIYSNMGVTLMRSTDSGQTWSVSETRMIHGDDDPYQNIYWPRSFLQEHTGLITLNMGGSNILYFDESYSGA